MIRFLTVLAVASIVAWTFPRTDWGQSAENVYYDGWHVLSGARYSPTRTAIVAVDDDTLVALKDDPFVFWAPHFGKAMDVIDRAGAKVVGFDFLFQVSAEGWLRKLDLPDSETSRNYDAPLREALARGNKVLIAQLVQPRQGKPQLILPPVDQLYLLPGGAQDVGIANLYDDADGHVRRFVPFVDSGLEAGTGFAMQLALRAEGADPAAPHWQIGGRSFTREARPLKIGYAGPPGTIPAVSMSRLLRDDALADPAVRALKDRVVIVASTSTGSPDRHLTPYSLSPGAGPMAGGEIHANAVETILSGREPTFVPAALELAWVIGVTALATALFLRLPAGLGAVSGVVIAALVPLPALAAFQIDWILPAAGPQAGILAAFLATLGLRLTGEERERRRIRQMFGRYVSDEVVDKLLSDERRPDLAGEMHNVTVLFSDIRNFTAISEKLSAHEVVEMLNAYFTRACEPILAQGGTVDKYIGDAVMAVFGSPIAHPDHARRAIRAALSMAAEAARFKEWMVERFPGRGLPEFGIGIGLNTGEAVIGDVGTPRRKEFTAIGDTVNAASRLEGVTKEMGCMIVAGESTLAAAGPGVRTGRSETVKVKGKELPIRAYEVTGLEA